MLDKEKLKTNRGITLIVLVVTIVVILILSGVTITAITDENGIWNKSNELAENTNSIIEESSQQVNNMVEELDEIMNPWVQNKTVVTKKLKSGTKTLNVGDDYTYDCGVSGYTGGWKVLGAENGKLLIMSTIDVGTLGLQGISGDGTTNYPAGYTNGIAKLNEICAPYGRNARSITVEDINRVTGYDPTNQGDGTVYGAGEFEKFGNKVTYTETGSSATNGQTYTGTISYEHPDGRKLGTDNVTSITVKSTYYSYYPYSLTDSNSTTGECKGIATDSPAYKLLFRNADDSANCSYWLASSYVNTSSSHSTFGIQHVYSDSCVNYFYLWSSDGNSTSQSLGVRAVVPVD